MISNAVVTVGGCRRVINEPTAGLRCATRRPPCVCEEEEQIICVRAHAGGSALYSSHLCRISAIARIGGALRDET